MITLTNDFLRSKISIETMTNLSVSLHRSLRRYGTDTYGRYD